MKKFFLFLLGLIVLAIIALTIFLLTFDLNSYRSYITEKLSETLGRPVEIGHMEMKVSMIPTVKISNIKISNPDHISSEDPFVSVTSAEATLAIAPLFSKRIEVQNVKADVIRLNLIQNGARDNWTIETPKQKEKVKSEAKSKSAWQVRVDSISAQQILVNYKNADKNYQLKLSDFSLKQLKVLSVTATWNEMPFKLTATVDDLLKLMRKEPDYLFNIEIVGADSTVKLAGSIGDTVSFKKLLLNADINGGSLKQTLADFAINHAAVPAQPFALSAVLQGDLSKFDVTKFEFALGGNKLKADFTGVLESVTRNPTVDMKGKVALSDWTLGQVWGIQPFNSDLDFNASKSEINLKRFSYLAGRSDIQFSGKLALLKSRPNITLNIYSEYFSLQDILQEKENKYHGQVAQDQKKNLTIPDLPVPLGFLKSFDGAFSVSMPHWHVSDKITGYLGTVGVLSVKNGVLSTHDFRVNLLGGNMVSDAVINANNGQQFALKVKGSNFNLNDVKALNTVIKDGVTDFDVNVTARGNTVHQIISSLNGDLEIEIPKGMIIDQFFNNDIVEALGGRKKRSVNYSTSDQVNELLCGAVKVKIENGEIKAQNNIALETPHVGFLVGGQIRLVDAWVNLSMRPIVYQIQQTTADKILNVATRAVRVIGNVPNVNFEPDTTEAIKGFLDQKTFKPYQTCAEVLGRKSKGQLTAEAKKMQMLPEPAMTEKAEEKKPSPQQQFLETLTQVLKK